MCVGSTACAHTAEGCLCFISVLSLLALLYISAQFTCTDRQQRQSSAVLVPVKQVKLSTDIQQRHPSRRCLPSCFTAAVLLLSCCCTPALLLRRYVASKASKTAGSNTEIQRYTSTGEEEASDYTRCLPRANTRTLHFTSTFTTLLLRSTTADAAVPPLSPQSQHSQTCTPMPSAS